MFLEWFIPLSFTVLTLRDAHIILMNPKDINI